MVEERGQLAIPGGQLPADAEHSPGNDSGLLVWIAEHVSPASTLAFADRHRRKLWAVTLIFYIAAFNGQWRIQPDAALYLSLGRNLATGRGYTYLDQPNLLAYPGWPALIAGTFKIFGSSSLVMVNVLMLLIALATVMMVYRLFLLHSGRPTAVVMSVGVGLTKAFFCYGFELWSDMPFALGAMSALAGYEGMLGRRNPSAAPLAAQAPPVQRRWLDRCFFAGGLLFAALMRPTIWPLIAAILLAIFAQTLTRKFHWRSFLTLSALIGTAAGVVVAVLLSHGRLHGYGSVYVDYLLNRITRGSTDTGTHSLAENVQNLFTWAASDVLFQTRLGPTCNELLSLLVIGLGFSLFRYRVLWGFWFSLLLATILISQETLDRYFLPVLPLLVYAWWKLLVHLYGVCREWSVNLSLPRPLPGMIFLALLSFGAFMNVTKVGGIIAQQRELPFLASYDKGTFEVINKFAKQVRNHTGPAAIILCKAPYGRVTAYLTDRFVTNGIDRPLEHLKGRPVFVVEPSDLLTQSKLRQAGLVEGPALFTVTPSPNHGEKAVAMSLHSTYKK
jgi:hypothetical protein